MSPPLRLDRNLAIFAAFNGAMAVTVGAFAAHGAAPGVKSLLTTGAQYQMVHAVLAAALSIWPAGRLFRAAGWTASAGGLIFCLTLSMIGLLSLPIMGALAPIGGSLMIVGWLLIALAALRSPTVKL